MNAYAFISKADDAALEIVRRVSRFSTRTAGAFAAYAAFSGESVAEVRETGERIAAAVEGDVEILLSAEPETSVSTRSGHPAGWPASCYDKATGRVDWNCLGSPEPSIGYKFAALAVVELTAERGLREELYARLTLADDIVGLGRMLSPGSLLVEVSNPDHQRMLSSLAAISSLPEVRSARAGVATAPVVVDAPGSEPDPPTSV